jgi:hypothetical protein
MLIFINTVLPAVEEMLGILIFVFQSLTWPTETHSALSFSVLANGIVLAAVINKVCAG